MTMNKQFLLLCSITVFFAACIAGMKETPSTVAMQGLASPIRLQLDTTLVELSDYLSDASKIERVEWNGQAWTADSLGVVTLLGAAPSPLSNLKVTYSGAMFDIPVFATNKIRHTFTYTPSRADVSSVELSGSMNGWNRKASPLVKNGDQWSIELVLNQGLYQYRVWEDGVEMMDASNPNTISNGMGGLNNTFQAGPVLTAQPMLFTERVEGSSIVLMDTDQCKNVQAYWENTLIPAENVAGKITIKLPAAAQQKARSHVRVFADNGVQRYNDVLVPLENGKVITSAAGLNRGDLRNTVMYFVMVDRFVDGEPGNNRPTPDSTIHPKANNLGGDLQGITQKIKDGYFEQLGINTIWISPITTNAEGAWGLWDNGVKSTFSAYHGYWPTSLRSIDNRLGSDAAMKELLSTAHARGMNVILDYVAHHVHQDHPLYKQKPEWTTPLYLPDGTMNTEKWDEHRLTTWFDTFLPTWKFADHAVVEALTDTAMYWVENYDLDGFRHDATKHIDTDFWRTLTRKVKGYQAKHPERNLYQIGETYGSPELISSYISSGQLDAQFDFNLYDAAVDAFAKPETNFSNLERVLDESMSYYGNHHLMGNITGNQDRARFISYADGSVQFSENAKLAGWTRDIQNRDTAGFKNMEMLMAFLMTTPGVPCIYYGDEIGMPGGNDPDNRRMMHFEDWSAPQRQLQEVTRKLVNLRRSNMALTYGELEVLYNEGGVLVFGRKYFDSVAVVVMNKGLSKEAITVTLPERYQLQGSKNLGNKDIQGDANQLTITGNAGFEVFTR
jgi:cyclomaltodextrinase